MPLLTHRWRSHDAHDFWCEGGETPCERARKPFGRLAFANADASAYSCTDAAIDNSLRAVADFAR